MAQSRERENRRRQFLRSLVRYPILGAMGVLGGRLLTRQATRGPVQAGQDCVNHSVCRGCGRLAGCGLPQGLMARSGGGHDQAKPYERTFY